MHESSMQLAWPLDHQDTSPTRAEASHLEGSHGHVDLQLLQLAAQSKKPAMQNTTKMLLPLTVSLNTLKQDYARNVNRQPSDSGNSLLLSVLPFSREMTWKLQGTIAASRNPALPLSSSLHIIIDSSFFSTIEPVTICSTCNSATRFAHVAVRKSKTQFLSNYKRRYKNAGKGILSPLRDSTLHEATKPRGRL
jgi:hypothetical protein